MCVHKSVGQPDDGNHDGTPLHYTNALCPHAHQTSCAGDGLTNNAILPMGSMCTVVHQRCT
eukprot:675472-Pyramimonas_sp.AAC.1